MRSDDLRLVLKAYTDVVRIDLQLRRGGLRSIVDTVDVENMPVDQLIDAATIQRARRYARRIKLACTLHPLRARCLHRSLILHTWLRHEGLPSMLRIGVTKQGNQLKAHAWVELDGRIVNDERAAIGAFIPLSSRELNRSSVPLTQMSGWTN